MESREDRLKPISTKLVLRMQILHPLGLPNIQLLQLRQSNHRKQSIRISRSVRRFFNSKRKQTLSRPNPPHSRKSIKIALSFRTLNSLKSLTIILGVKLGKTESVFRVLKTSILMKKEFVVK